MKKKISIVKKTILQLNSIQHVHIDTELCGRIATATRLFQSSRDDWSHFTTFNFDLIV